MAGSVNEGKETVMGAVRRGVMSVLGKYLDDAEERCKKATKGPFLDIGYDCVVLEPEDPTTSVLVPLTQETRHMLACARTDVEVMGKMVKKMRAGGEALMSANYSMQAQTLRALGERMLRDLEELVPKEAWPVAYRKEK